MLLALVIFIAAGNTVLGNHSLCAYFPLCDRSILVDDGIGVGVVALVHFWDARLMSLAEHQCRGDMDCSLNGICNKGMMPNAYYHSTEMDE
jgi:hypothetical protein